MRLFVIASSFFAILAGFLGITLTAAVNPPPNQNKEQISFGIFYSYRNAEYWGLDRKEALTKLLDELDVDWVTLPIFWNESVDETGKLNLEILDWQINEVRKYHKQVILTLGIKAPGYPEFYHPEKFNASIRKGQEISPDDAVAKDFLQFLPKAVDYFAKYDNIKAWQVENEPLWTSIDGLKIDEELVRKEIEIVKINDPQKRPVLVNHPATPPWNNDYKKIISLLEESDYLGINVHTKTRPPVLVYFKIFGKLISIPWPSIINIPVYNLGPLAPNLNKIKEEAQKNSLEVIVTELQAEPYFADDKEEQGNALFKFTPKDIGKNVKLIKNAGIDQITFWGAGYWLSQSQKGDTSWLDAVKKTL